MHSVKINNQTCKIPTSLKEVTTGQFFKLRKAKNILDEVCALAGLDRMETMNFAQPEDIKNAYALMAPIAKELAENKIEGRKLPDCVFIGGKVIDVPKKPELQPVGAYINVHNIMAEETNRLTAAGLEINFTDIIPRVLCHYFYVPYYGGLYDDEKAEGPAFMKLIEQIPFVQAVPIANFFFRKFPNF